MIIDLPIEKESHTSTIHWESEITGQSNYLGKRKFKLIPLYTLTPMVIFFPPALSQFSLQSLSLSLSPFYFAQFVLLFYFLQSVAKASLG